MRLLNSLGSKRVNLLHDKFKSFKRIRPDKVELSSEVNWFDAKFNLFISKHLNAFVSIEIRRLHDKSKSFFNQLLLDYINIGCFFYF